MIGTGGMLRHPNWVFLSSDLLESHVVVLKHLVDDRLCAMRIKALSLSQLID